MIDEYTFSCVYCGKETMSEDPYPNAAWTKSYNERGWVCSEGQCRVDLRDTKSEEEGIQSDYEAHCEEEAKYDAIEREANGNEPHPWRFE